MGLITSSLSNVSTAFCPRLADRFMGAVSSPRSTTTVVSASTFLNRKPARPDVERMHGLPLSGNAQLDRNEQAAQGTTRHQAAFALIF